MPRLGVGVGVGVMLPSIGGAAAPTVAITYPLTGAAIDKTLGDDTPGKIDFAGTFTGATSVELFTDVGNTGTFTSRGTATLGSGTWTYQHTIVAGDVNSVVKVKAVATGAGGSTDSTVITLVIVDMGSNLVSYYDARTVTLNGSDVSSWTDKKATNHLVSGAGNQPAYLATGSPTGKPAISFDGVSEYLKATFTRNQPTVTLIHAKWTDNTAANQYIADGATSYRGSIAWVTSVVVSRAGALLNYSPQPSSGSWYVYEALFNSTSSANALNGGTRTTGDSGALNPAGFTVGSTGGATYFGQELVTRALVTAADFASANTRAAAVAWVGRG